MKLTEIEVKFLNELRRGLEEVTDKLYEQYFTGNFTLPLPKEEGDMYSTYQKYMKKLDYITSILTRSKLKEIGLFDELIQENALVEAQTLAAFVELGEDMKIVAKNEEAMQIYQSILLKLEADQSN